MLFLVADTAPDWAGRALGALDAVLLDHAHLEKKAASTAIGLLFRYPNDAGLQAPLSALAREELEHFEAVLGVLAARGIPFEAQVPAPYMGRLHRAVRRAEPHRLLDTLLVCALIEARSCERMKRLSEALPDEALAAFYAGLLASEARHFQGYVELAYARFPREEVRSRLAELAAFEASVLYDAASPTRLHN